MTTDIEVSSVSYIRSYSYRDIPFYFPKDDVIHLFSDEAITKSTHTHTVPYRGTPINVPIWKVQEYDSNGEPEDDCI